MRNAENHERQAIEAQNRMRNYYFAFQNALIQQFETHLNWKATRLLAFMLCKIRPEDSSIQDYSFSVREYCDVCGIGCDSGRSYECVKEAFNDVVTACAHGIGKHADEVLKWFESGYFDTENHVFRYQFSEEIAPYLFNLQSRYTQIKLDEVMRLKSVYSQRLYILMRSYSYHGDGKTWYFTAEEARTHMGCKYKRFTDFKRIIEKVCNEIFIVSGMRLDIETRKTKQKRRVDSVKVEIKKAGNTPTEVGVIRRAALERQQKEQMKQARREAKRQKSMHIHDGETVKRAPIAERIAKQARTRYKRGISLAMRRLKDASQCKLKSSCTNNFAALSVLD